MTTYLLAIAFIFSLALGGILIDRVYRRFAAENPQLGPFRDPGKCGCCSAGSGCDTACSAEPPISAMKHH
jgi:hypothetical protein